MKFKKQRGMGSYIVGGLLAIVSMLLGIDSVSLAAPLLPVPVSTVPSNGDQNPYGVLFVTGNPGGTLKPLDILVSNFNNKGNVMGTGTTIVDIRNGVRLPTPFYTAPNGLRGVDLALHQVGNFIVVGNVPVSGSTPGPGALTVVNSSGHIVQVITDPNHRFIDGPWGLAGNSSGASFTLYVSNLLNATVWRLNGTITSSGLDLASATQIGGGYLKDIEFPNAANGPAGLAGNSNNSILYVASEIDNEIFAITNPAIRGTTTTRGTLVYSDRTHLHGPTGLRVLLNGDIITANDDGFNAVATDPSELVEFTPSGHFVTQYSVDPSEGGAFGVNFFTTGNDTRLAYVDDVTATLSVLSLFETFP
ncbi:MAG TPA: hypothetical protein VJ728_14075 [Candidatus Binataceae bacterium]|nr:hypothetical protein [Candidatus Binataceae bacterium]